MANLVQTGLHEMTIVIYMTVAFKSFTISAQTTSNNVTTEVIGSTLISSITDTTNFIDSSSPATTQISTQAVTTPSTTELITPATDASTNATSLSSTSMTTPRSPSTDLATTAPIQGTLAPAVSDESTLAVITVTGTDGPTTIISSYAGTTILTQETSDPNEPAETSGNLDPSAPTETSGTPDPSAPTETSGSPYPATETPDPNRPTETSGTPDPSAPTETSGTPDPSAPTETSGTPEPSAPIATSGAPDPSAPTAAPLTTSKPEKISTEGRNPTTISPEGSLSPAALAGIIVGSLVGGVAIVGVVGYAVYHSQYLTGSTSVAPSAITMITMTSMEDGPMHGVPFNADPDENLIGKKSGI